MDLQEMFHSVLKDFDSFLYVLWVWKIAAHILKQKITGIILE